MKGLMLVAIFLSCLPRLSAQEVRAELSTQEVLEGHYFVATVFIENLTDAELTPPDLSDFDLVSGPNRSHRVQIINGTVTESESREFYLRPRRQGVLYFPPITVEANGQFYETEPLEVTVLPNPDQLPQPREERAERPFGLFGPPTTPAPRGDAPPRPQRRKRKIYRI